MVSLITLKPVYISDLYPGSVVANCIKGYRAGENAVVRLFYNEQVVVSGLPRIVVQVGGVERYFTYHKGSGTNILEFILFLDPQWVGQEIEWIYSSVDLNGGAIHDANGDTTITNYLPVSDKVKIYPQAEGILSLSHNLNGYLMTGQVITFQLTYPYPAHLRGTPRIPIYFGRHIRYATPTSAYTFTYTIQASDKSTSVRVGDAINYDHGTIRSESGYDIIPFLGPFSGPVDVNINQDPPVPVITQVVQPSGNYAVGNSILLSARFDQAVIVTGHPYVRALIGPKGVKLLYHSGSGTDTVVFRYICQTGDTGNIVIKPNIILGSGAIIGVYGKPANLTFAVSNVPASANGAAPSVHHAADSTGCVISESSTSAVVLRSSDSAGLHLVDTQTILGLVELADTIRVIVGDIRRPILVSIGSLDAVESSVIITPHTVSRGRSHDDILTAITELHTLGESVYISSFDYLQISTTTGRSQFVRVHRLENLNVVTPTSERRFVQFISADNTRVSISERSLQSFKSSDTTNVSISTATSGAVRAHSTDSISVATSTSRAIHTTIRHSDALNINTWNDVVQFISTGRSSDVIAINHSHEEGSFKYYLSVSDTINVNALQTSSLYQVHNKRASTTTPITIVGTTRTIGVTARRAESTSVSVSDIKRPIVVRVSSADTVGVAAVELPTKRGFTKSDTLGATITDQSRTISVVARRADITSIAVQDRMSAIRSTTRTSSSIAVATVESHAVQCGNTASSTISCSVSDSARAILVRVSASDTVAISTTESSKGRASNDTAVVQVVGTVQVISVRIASADSIVVSLADNTEARSSNDTIGVQTSEAVRTTCQFTASDSVDTSISTAHTYVLFERKTDSLAVSTSEHAGTIAVAISSADTVAVTAAADTNERGTVDAVVIQVTESTATTNAFTSADTINATVSENTTVATVVTSDNITIATSETTAQAVSLSSTDDISISISDKDITRNATDITRVAVEETTATMCIFTSSDSVDVAATEVSANTAMFAGSDTIDTQTSESQSNVVFVTRTDIVGATIEEPHAGMIEAAATRTDASALTVSDDVTEIFVTIATADTILVATSEATASANVAVNGTDSIESSVSEQFVINVFVEINETVDAVIDTSTSGDNTADTNDTLVVQLSDTSAVAWLRSSNDSILVQIFDGDDHYSSTETAGISVDESSNTIITSVRTSDSLNAVADSQFNCFVSVSTSDSVGVVTDTAYAILGSVSSSDTVNIAITGSTFGGNTVYNSDDASFAVTMQPWVVSVVVNSADTASVAADDASEPMNMAFSGISSDQLDCSITESSTVFVSVSSSDNVDVSTAEQSTLNCSVNKADTCAVSFSTSVTTDTRVSRTDTITVTTTEYAVFDWVPQFSRYYIKPTNANYTFVDNTQYITLAYTGSSSVGYPIGMYRDVGFGTQGDFIFEVAFKSPFSTTNTVGIGFRDDSGGNGAITEWGIYKSSGYYRAIHNHWWTDTGWFNWTFYHQPILSASTPPPNDMFRLRFRRVQSTLYFDYSVDNGLTWVATDSGTYNVMSLFIYVTGTASIDMYEWNLTQYGVVAVTNSASGTVNVSTSEARTQRAYISRTDTTDVEANQITDAINTTITRSDTTAAATSENSSQFVTLSFSDTVGIATSESSQTFYIDAISGSDIVNVHLFDGDDLVRTSDTISLSITESTQQNVSVATSDTISLSVAMAVIQGVTASASDTVGISVSTDYQITGLVSNSDMVTADTSEAVAATMNAFSASDTIEVLVNNETVSGADTGQSSDEIGVSVEEVPHVAVVFRTLQAFDTINFAATDTPIDHLVVFTSTDDSELIAEESYSYPRFVTVDTGAPADIQLTSTVRTIPVEISTSDSIDVSVSEPFIIDVTTASSDATDVAVDELSTNLHIDAIHGEDTIIVHLFDGDTAIRASSTVGISVSEASRTIFTSVDRTDSIGVVANDVKRVIEVVISSSDNVDVAVTETPSGYAVVPASDTVSVSLVTTYSIAYTLRDTIAASITEQTALFVTVQSSDTVAPTLTTVADSVHLDPITGSDTINVHLFDGDDLVHVSDTAGISLNESSNIDVIFSAMTSSDAIGVSLSTDFGLDRLSTDTAGVATVGTLVSIFCTMSSSDLLHIDLNLTSYIPVDAGLVLGSDDNVHVALTEATSTFSDGATTDTNSVAVSTTYAIKGAVARADTAAVSVTETPSVVVYVSSSDTVAVSLSTVQTTLVVLIDRDTEHLGVSETEQSSIHASVNRTETLSVRTDATVTKSFRSADTLATTVVETDGSGLLARMTRSDTVGVAVTATVATLKAIVNRSDTTAVSLTTAKIIAASVTSADTVGPTITTTPHFTNTCQTNDTISVSITEASRTTQLHASSDTLNTMTYDGDSLT